MKKPNQNQQKTHKNNYCDTCTTEILRPSDFYTSVRIKSEGNSVHRNIVEYVFKWNIHGHLCVCKLGSSLGTEGTNVFKGEIILENKQ